MFLLFDEITRRESVNRQFTEFPGVATILTIAVQNHAIAMILTLSVLSSPQTGKFGSRPLHISNLIAIMVESHM